MVATTPTSHKVQNKDTLNTATEGMLSGVWTYFTTD
jgi:hypothetical protein